MSECVCVSVSVCVFVCERESARRGVHLRFSSPRGNVPEDVREEVGGHFLLGLVERALVPAPQCVYMNNNKG